MADASVNPYQPGKDTRPLAPSDLSPREVEIIREIETRIYNVRAVAVGKPDRRDKRDDYFAHAQQRYRRVLLLDGDRGTGKTSVLVTLVQRWNSPASKEFDAIVGSPRPDFVRVLPILDFDPLPPGMPLAAGIIQAWRPLVNHYEDISRNTISGRENESDTLLDRWLKLFRVAAVGWTGIPQQTGLIEQVLDREEQVGDWQRLDRQWYDFVEDVIEFATTRVPQPTGPLPPDPVFVIMIDDVDLQVGRVRELLPALRLLYHPSVVFVVAAHRKHLLDMLALDFLGQQQKLACFTGPGPSLWGAADADRWAGDLALSAFQKVFAKTDLWRLDPLSLSAWLEFPGKPFTFREVLNGRGKPLTTAESVELTHSHESLGDYVRSFAILRQRDGPGASRVMTYRKAQQLADEIFTAKDPRGMANATDLLCRLLDPSESETVAVPGLGKTPVVEFRAVGEVTALFSPEIVEVIYPRLHEIVLSGRPKFIFRAEAGLRTSSENHVGGSDVIEAALLAISLQDSKRGVVAPGLKWGGGLSFAWTRWMMNDHAVNAAFRWPLHVLPTPLRLFEWAAEWADFLREVNLAAEAKDRRDRIAYGWIYHQLLWLDVSLQGIAKPVTANMDDANVWNRLLAKKPPADTDSKLGKDRWARRTLPLLARPEIGLTAKVQERLLNVESKQKSRKDLVAERRRLVRDAFDAAAAESGESIAGSADEDTRVSAVLSAIDRQYKGAPWHRFINDLPDARERH